MQRIKSFSCLLILLFNINSLFSQDLRQPENPANVLQGLEYSYYENDGAAWSLLPDFSLLTPTTVALTDVVDDKVAERTENFGLVFKGFIDIPEDGSWTFYTRSDDGSKLFIGDQEVVDNDGLHGSVERSGSLELQAGKHAITVVFFERTGGDFVELYWQSANQVKQLVPASAYYIDQINGYRVPENLETTSQGLVYSYYENDGAAWTLLPGFSLLTPTTVALTDVVDDKVAERTENFGLVFEGYIDIPEDDNWTFYTRSDDGSKLFIGDQEIVDNDGLHGSVERSGQIKLKTGKHKFIVEFFERTGGDFVELYWQSANHPKEQIPAIAYFRNLPLGTTYTVNLLSAGNGSLSGDIQQSVLEGESTTAVTAIADSGYTFQQWDDGNTENPRIVSNISSNLTLTAQFGLKNSGLVADFYITTQNETLTVPVMDGVLQNDFGNNLQAELVSNTSTGLLTLASDGSFEYIPQADFEGIETFTYKFTGFVSEHVATVTLAVKATSGAQRDVYNNITGMNLSQLRQNPIFLTPDLSDIRTNFEGPTNIADQYATRMRALVIAPISGTYRFYIASDDSSELLFSTNTTGENTTKIAGVGSWTSSRQWNKFSSQQSSEITLSAGQVFYLEALTIEGGGGDNLAVGWSINGSDIDIIRNSYLIPLVEQFTINFLADENGSIQGNNNQIVNSGESTSSVTASAVTGYQFVRWSDGNTDNPRIINNVTSNATYTAEFSINEYSVNFTSGGNGTLEGNLNQTILHGGSTSSVTASAATGYHFLRWSDGNTDNPRIINNVTSNTTYTAEFSINEYSVNFTSGGNGTLEGNQNQTILHGGSTSSVTASASTGYHFERWSDGNTDNPRVIDIVTSNASYTAEFSINQYSVIYLSDENGTIEGDAEQTVTHGTNTISVTAIAKTGYTFVRWNDGLQTESRSDENIISNQVFEAEFKVNVYSVKFASAGNGSLIGDINQFVLYNNSTSQVTAVPSDGFIFDKWLEDNDQNPVKIINPVTSDATFTASFKKQVFTVNFIPGANGSIQGESNQQVTYGGSTSSVTAVPNVGFSFLNWSDENLVNPLVINDVTQNLDLSAAFTPTKPKLISHENYDVLRSSNATFIWSEINNSSSYTLTLGNVPGGNSYGTYTTSEERVSVTNLPVDGSIIHVRLSSDTQGIQSSTDYVIFGGFFATSYNLQYLYRAIAENSLKNSPENFKENYLNTLNLFSSNNNLTTEEQSYLELLRAKMATLPHYEFVERSQESQQVYDISSIISDENELVDYNLVSSSNFTLNGSHFTKQDRYMVLSNSLYPNHNLPLIGDDEITVWPYYYGAITTENNLLENDYLPPGQVTFSFYHNGNAGHIYNLLYNGCIQSNILGINIGCWNSQSAYGNNFSVSGGYLVGIGSIDLNNPDLTKVSIGSLKVNVLYKRVQQYRSDITTQPIFGSLGHINKQMPSSVSSNIIDMKYTAPANYSGPDKFSYKFKDIENTTSPTVLKDYEIFVNVKKNNYEHLYLFNEISPFEIDYSNLNEGYQFNNYFNKEFIKPELNLNGATAKYVYNGSGGTALSFEPTNVQDTSINGPIVTYNINGKYSIETRLRFPSGQTSGIVLAESSHRTYKYMEWLLREDGKLECYLKNLLIPSQKYRVITTSPLNLNDWVNISAKLDLNGKVIRLYQNGIELTTSKSGTFPNNVPSTFQRIKLLKRFKSSSSQLPQLEVDMLRIVKDLSGDYSFHEGQKLSNNNNDEILVSEYDFLNRLQLTPEKYNELKQSNNLNNFRNNNPDKFYNQHPTVYGSYKGMNEFNFFVKSSVILNQNSKATVYFKKGSAEQEWKKLSSVDLNDFSVSGDYREVFIPWNTNIVAESWTQDFISQKNVMDIYKFKVELTDAQSTNSILEVNDYINGAFQHTFSYDPFVFSSSPDRKFSSIYFDWKRKNRDQVLRDEAVFELDEIIEDIVIRKKISNNENYISSINESELLSAQSGATFSDGTEVLYIGDLTKEIGPIEIEAPNQNGRYSYKTYTRFGKAGIFNKIVDGSEYIVDSSSEGGAVTNLDNKPPYIPEVITSPGDSQVALSWTYKELDTGTETDIETNKVIIEYLHNGKTIVEDLGNVRHAVIKGLNNGIEYTFKLRTEDKNNNFSETTVTATPRKFAQARIEVNSFEAMAGTNSVVLKWKYPAGAINENNATGFLRWKHEDSLKGGIGFIVVRNDGVSATLIAALPIDYSNPQKEYLIIDENLEEDSEYTYTIMTIDRDNVRSKGLAKTIRTLTEDLIESSEAFFSLQDGLPWYGSVNGAIPGRFEDAPQPEFVINQNIWSINAAIDVSSLGQRIIEENDVFSVSVEAKVLGENSNNSGLTILQFHNYDDEEIKGLTLFNDKIELDGNSYNFVHGNKKHRYDISRIGGQTTLLVDGFKLSPTGAAQLQILNEAGNAFFRFGAQSINTELQVEFHDLYYVIGVPLFHNQGKSLDFKEKPITNGELSIINSEGSVSLTGISAADPEQASLYKIKFSSGLTTYSLPGSAGELNETISLPAFEQDVEVSLYDYFGNISSAKSGLVSPLPQVLNGTDLTATNLLELNSLSVEEVLEEDLNSFDVSGDSWFTHINGSSNILLLDDHENWSVELLFAVNDTIINGIPTVKSTDLFTFTNIQDQDVKLVLRPDGLMLNSSLLNSVTLGGESHKIRLVNQKVDEEKYTLHIFIDEKYVTTTQGFTLRQLEIGDTDSNSNLLISNLTVVKDGYDSALFLPLTGVWSSNQPFVQIDQLGSVRSENTISTQLSSADYVNVTLELYTKTGTKFSKSTPPVLRIENSPRVFFDEGTSAFIQNLSFELETDSRPFPYIVKLLPVNSKSQAAKGDAKAFYFTDYIVSGVNQTAFSLSTSTLNLPWSLSINGTVENETDSNVEYYADKVVKTGPPAEFSEPVFEDYLALNNELTATDSWEFSSYINFSSYSGAVVKLLRADNSTIDINYDGKDLKIDDSYVISLDKSLRQLLKVSYVNNIVKLTVNNDITVEVINLNSDTNYIKNIQFGNFETNFEEPVNLSWSLPRFIKNGILFENSSSYNSEWSYVSTNGFSRPSPEDDNLLGFIQVTSFENDITNLIFTDSTLPQYWTAEFDAAGNGVVSLTTNLSGENEFTSSLSVNGQFKKLR